MCDSCPDCPECGQTIPQPATPGFLAGYYGVAAAVLAILITGYITGIVTQTNFHITLGAVTALILRSICYEPHVQAARKAGETR